MFKKRSFFTKITVLLIILFSILLGFVLAACNNATLNNGKMSIPSTYQNTKWEKSNGDYIQFNITNLNFKRDNTTWSYLSFDVVEENAQYWKILLNSLGLIRFFYIRKPPLFGVTEDTDYPNWDIWQKQP